MIKRSVARTDVLHNEMEPEIRDSHDPGTSCQNKGAIIK